jgi:hypothetical protein
MLQTNWRWTDASRKTVYRTFGEDGMESHLVDAVEIVAFLEEGGVPDEPLADE